jgi:hypothetical protein
MRRETGRIIRRRDHSGSRARGFWGISRDLMRSRRAKGTTTHMPGRNAQATGPAPEYIATRTKVCIRLRGRSKSWNVLKAVLEREHPGGERRHDRRAGRRKFTVSQLSSAAMQAMSNSSCRTFCIKRSISSSGARPGGGKRGTAQRSRRASPTSDCVSPWNTSAGRQVFARRRLPAVAFGEGGHQGVRATPRRTKTAPRSA